MIGCTLSWTTGGHEVERTYCLLEPCEVDDTGMRLHRVTKYALESDPNIDDVLAAFGLVFVGPDRALAVHWYAEKEQA